MTAPFEIFDPLLSAEQADAIVRLCEDHGSYGSYAEEGTNEVQFAPDVPNRYDAAANFVRSGGRFGRHEEPAALAVRTNYFRETYAYDEALVPGIEPMLHHQGFVAAAKRVHRAEVIVPNIVYANLLVPGQELAVHTDVPEFRGANRKLFPQWLMVVMHHAGLFDAWRIRIATAIAYFRQCDGGDLAYYPDGREGAARTLRAQHNTAILLDTDSVFHGVDRVAESTPLPALRPGMKLRYRGSDHWEVGPEGEAPLAEYDWDEIRFSVSWKAYGYRDEAERRAAEDHTDDLDLDRILDTLVADLRGRGRLEGAVPSDHDLALLLIDEYIRFPSASPKAA